MSIKSNLIFFISREKTANERKELFKIIDRAFKATNKTLLNERKVKYHIGKYMFSKKEKHLQTIKDVILPEFSAKLKDELIKQEKEGSCYFTNLSKLHTKLVEVITTSLEVDSIE